MVTPPTLLTRRDPATLAPIGPSVTLNGMAEAFSPDGSMLAFVQWIGDVPSVRILDLARMRWRAEFPLGLATATIVVRWIDSRRALVLAAQPDGVRVFVLNALTNSLSAPSRIAGAMTDPYQTLVGVSRTRAAFMIEPPGVDAAQQIRPVHVAVISYSGWTRIVTLKKILERGSPNDSLVADPSTDRAYVVGAITDPVATIDLNTLTVSYRKPFESSYTGPVASSSRTTAWLGNGRFAVAGWDHGPAPGQDASFLGLRIVDTRSWETRTIDPDADSFCVAGHFLVGRHHNRFNTTSALVVFSFAGVYRLTLTPPAAPPTLSAPVPTASNDRYLYVVDPGVGAAIVDLASNKLIGRRPIQDEDELLSPTYTLGAGCR